MTVTEKAVISETMVDHKKFTRKEKLGILVVGVLGVVGIIQVVHDYNEKQAELDTLCGEDLSGCDVSYHVICLPSWSGTGANCTKVPNYLQKK